MNVTARQADPADLDRVGELGAAAATELAALRGGAIFVGREAAPAPGVDALSDTRRRVLVGCVDDAILGYADVRLDPGRDGTLIARIEALYVEPDGRGVGVGEELMAGIVDWAVAQGAHGIDAIALPGARETKNFFEASGFTARLLLMHHRLS